MSMPLLETLQGEMKKALREKASDRLQVLRLLISEIKNEAYKEGKKRDSLEVVMAYHKRLVKAKEDFGDKNQTYSDNLAAEIKIIEEFLPTLMSEDELKNELVALAGSGTKIDLKTVMPLFKGKADARMLQTMIKNWTEG